VIVKGLRFAAMNAQHARSLDRRPRWRVVASYGKNVFFSCV
jgi:hypothetical protein